eukprot:scaffold268904_cov33-Tisochrysis_lutea.AAC.1
MSALDVVARLRYRTRASCVEWEVSRADVDSAVVSSCVATGCGVPVCWPRELAAWKKYGGWSVPRAAKAKCWRRCGARQAAVGAVHGERAGGAAALICAPSGRHRGGGGAAGRRAY